MARRLVEVVECDVCGSAEGIASYSITSPIGTSELELCGKHQTVLDEVFNSGRVRKRPGRRPKAAATAAKKPTDQKGAPKQASKKATKKASAGKKLAKRSAEPAPTST